MYTSTYYSLRNLSIVRWLIYSGPGLGDLGENDLSAHRKWMIARELPIIPLTSFQPSKGLRGLFCFLFSFFSEWFLSSHNHWPRLCLFPLVFGQCNWRRDKTEPLLGDTEIIKTKPCMLGVYIQKGLPSLPLGAFAQIKLPSACCHHGSIYI